MQRPRILITAVILSSLIGFSFGWALFDEKRSSLPALTNSTEVSFENSPLNIRDLEEVWKSLRDHYYDASKLDMENLEYGAVKGFVDGVDDPYTVFMTPEESKEFEDGLEGQLEGIGAELEMKNGALVVVTPLKSSPAEKAGVKPGDIILKINDDTTENMTLFQAVKKIRGKRGATVTLLIYREGETKPLEFTITRQAITIDSVTAKKLDGNIFHISINQFNDHTKKEFSNAIQKILLENGRGMILDLRGNGGGYLDSSVDILSEFIAGEKTAAIIKHRDSKNNETVKTNGKARIPDIPLAILVNRGSASASEIVAGAIQDYKRGLIVGEKTFGKGSVQELDKLTDGSTLRLTIAKWFTPLDRSIDEIGITPDREVKLTDEDVKTNRDPQLEEAVKIITRSR